MNKYILRRHQTGAVEAAVARAPEAEKPTILLMIDRNELEDQMLKNLAALSLGNLEHAGSTARLNRLLKDDYRGPA